MWCALRRRKGMEMLEAVSVIGAGLAGCEAAFQLAERGIPVKLHEMKPEKRQPAHKADTFAELEQSLCWCGKKATMNTRVDAQGRVIREGEQVLIDTGEAVTYIGLCYKHWKQGKSGLCGNV